MSDSVSLGKHLHWIGDFIGLFASLYQIYLSYLFGIPSLLVMVRQSDVVFPSLLQEGMNAKKGSLFSRL